MNEFLTVAELLNRRHHELTPRSARSPGRSMPSTLCPVSTQSRGWPLVPGVSAPTVIRLVDKLGFAVYPDFQQALKNELSQRLSSPLAMYGSINERHAGGTSRTLQQASETFQEGIRSSLAQISPDDLAAAADLILDPQRWVMIVGGRFSGVLARYLAAHIREVRPRSVHVSDSPADRAATLLDISRKDVVVAFDYRRYQRDTVRFGVTAKQQGAKVVLFTDPWLSPLASSADVVLQTSVTAPSPFDSLVPAMALVEALVAALVQPPRRHTQIPSRPARRDHAGGHDRR